MPVNQGFFEIINHFIIKNIKFNGRIKDGDIIETQEYNYNFKKNKSFQNTVFVCIIISAIITIAFSLFEFLSYKKRTEAVINNLQDNIMKYEQQAYNSLDEYEKRYEYILKLLERYQQTLDD